MNRKTVFDAIRAARGKGFGPGEVLAIDQLLDNLGVPREEGPRKIGTKGIATIKQFEGIRLKAYPDPATGGEPWTIGVGHTNPGVIKPGMIITEAQADEYLRKDVARFEAAVNRLAPVTTQDQFDALVSIAFNIGEGNLSKSTLLKKHNAGDYDGAAAEFVRWNKAAGKEMLGLTRRREAEARLYRGLA